MPPPGKISVISQSARCAWRSWTGPPARSSGLGKVISFGNKADLNEVDFSRRCRGQADQRHRRATSRASRKATSSSAWPRKRRAVKPVVILKVGITQAGAKAASSHTGSLAGADIAYGAAFRAPA
jgi:acetate---CoA ligase (ADP-forming)